jgi:hypothetical protein
MRYMRIACLVIVTLLLAYPCGAAIVTIDADSFTEGADISDGFNGITLSSVGGFPGLDGKVYAYSDGLASTGTKVFGNNLGFARQWYADLTQGFAFRADFSKPADSISIDIIGDDYSGVDFGILYAYNASNLLLDTVVTTGLGYGQVFNAEILRPSFDIAYIIAGGSFLTEDTVHLDNLRINIIPEPATMLLFGLGGIFLTGRRKG